MALFGFSSATNSPSPQSVHPAAALEEIAGFERVEFSVTVTKASQFLGLRTNTVKVCSDAFEKPGFYISGLLSQDTFTAISFLPQRRTKRIVEFNGLAGYSGNLRILRAVAEDVVQFKMLAHIQTVNGPLYKAMVEFKYIVTQKVN